jgi:inositol transport system substrate-binding protein
MTACGSAPATSTSQSASAGSSAAPKKLTIGVALMNLQIEFSILLRDAIQEQADKAGVTVLINDAQGDASKQLSQVQAFVGQGVDGIILQPLEQEASSPCITAAQSAKIPIINVNSHTKAEPDAFVGSDDHQAAEIALNFIKEKLNGKGNVVMMHGHSGQTAEIQRTEGAMNVIKGAPGLKLLDEQTANWDRGQATTLMENWLQKYPNDINAVFAQNDEMALGAANAVVQAGKKDNIIVVGVDAVADALNAVKKGDMDATVFQDGKAQGAGSVDTIVKLIQGGTVEKQVLIPFKLVTAENVADFLGK